MRIASSSRAVDDLTRIGDFIARDNPSRAMSFIAELRDTTERLADVPHGFPMVPRYERHGIRRRARKGYGILCSVSTDRLFVHRIIGPGQDHDRALRLR